MKNYISIAILFILGGCSSLPEKTNQLDVGDTKAQVFSLMGSPDTQATNDGIELLEYYGVTAFGVCNYQQIWLKDSKIIKLHGYNNASIAGCEVGLKRADWGTVIAKYSDKEAAVNEISENNSAIEMLSKLSELYKSGALTEEEYIQMKKRILDKVQ